MLLITFKMIYTLVYKSKYKCLKYVTNNDYKSITNNDNKFVLIY